MSTLKEEFHALGNWHNKISMGSIVTREMLADPNLIKLPHEELKKIIAKAVKTMGQFEQFISGADKAAEKIKPFVYEKLGRDTEIPQRRDIL